MEYEEVEEEDEEEEEEGGGGGGGGGGGEGEEEEAAAFTLHAPLATKQRHDATASRLAPEKKRNFLSIFPFFIFVPCRSFIF